MKKIILAFLTLSLATSCKQEKSTASSNEQTTVPQIQKDIPEQKPVASPKVLTEATLDLTKYGIANNTKNELGGLKVGDLAPDFSIKDNRGRTVVLSEVTEYTPVLLTFYRGAWCGYCTKQLAEFQDELKAINALGHTRVMAVTPQDMTTARKMASDMGIFYSVISDEDHDLMKNYKVFFHVTDAYNQKVVSSKGQSLEKMNNDDTAVLPVPATYLIGNDMRIKYVFYDPDYSKRPDLTELKAAMQ